jgi:hypothetical protein
LYLFYTFVLQTKTNKNTMAIAKQFLKSKPVCKVTFSLSADVVADAKDVAVVGEFND